MLIEVSGTFGPTGWHNGDYEGRRGIVLSLLNTTNDDFQSTARVRFEKPVNPLQPILAVPVEFLSPVHPEKVGEVVDEMRRLGRERFVVEMGIGSAGLPTSSK